VLLTARRFYDTILLKKAKGAFMKTVFLILLIYFSILSLISVIYCLYDKIAAKKFPKNRVPERALFSLSAFGGSVAMLLAMLSFRHKTKHKRFMIGIPAIIFAQLCLFGLALFLVYRFHLESYLPAGFERF
jgi:uncharacterized membrane protein YsdA (DUF1294 family)